MAKDSVPESKVSDNSENANRDYFETALSLLELERQQYESDKKTTLEWIADYGSRIQKIENQLRLRDTDIGLMTSDQKKEIKGLEKARTKLFAKNERLSSQLETCLEREIYLRSIMTSASKGRESLNLSRFSLFIAFSALVVSIYSGHRFMEIEDNTPQQRLPALKSSPSNSGHTEKESPFPLNLKDLNQRIP